MQRTAFSIASIMLLMAVLAVFFAAAGDTFREPRGINKGLMIGCGVVGVMVGLLLGGVIGLKQTERFFGTLIGSLSGGLAGLAAGILVAGPFRPAPLLIGSAVLILFGAVVRRFSHRR